MTSGPTSTDDGGVGDVGERGIVVAGNGGGLGSAGAGVLDGSDDVGSATAGGDADDDIFAGGAAAGDVALADLGRVLIDIGGRCQRFRTAGHNVLDLCGQGGVGWGALGRVERGDAAAGAGADIDQPASVAQGAGDGVDDDGDLGERLLDGGSDLGVFVVDDARDFEGGLGVESLGCGVCGLRREIVEFCCASVDGFRGGGLLEHGKGCHRCPAVLLIPFYSFSN